MKITKEELQDLQKQEASKTALRNDIGALEAHKHNFLHQYGEIEALQSESKKALESKYGKINIDLKDGSYKVIEDEKQS
jgi:hypothetical protein|tara:strand:- start:142 stop:378 length:237 start_codon:yes stop_codon:yes gene_type:complete